MFEEYTFIEENKLNNISHVYSNTDYNEFYKQGWIDNLSINFVNSKYLNRLYKIKKK